MEFLVSVPFGDSIYLNLCNKRGINVYHNVSVPFGDSIYLNPDMWNSLDVIGDYVSVPFGDSIYLNVMQ